MNPFESGVRKAIPAVLIYVRRGDDVLMIHRDARGAAVDYHAGKWNGLGGKCEADESPLEAAVRELKEESGLDLPVSSFRSLGVLQFPNFKAHKNEDWIVWVFEASLNAGAEALSTLRMTGGPEGSLHWVPANKLTELNLWAGDRFFIPYVAESKPFIGTIWYQGQNVVRHWVTGV